MSEDPAWFGALITGAGLAFGLYQFRMNSRSAEKARTRERAIKAADELEKFHSDEAVVLALRMIDYETADIPVPDVTGRTITAFPVDRAFLKKALQHHTVRNPSKNGEKGDLFSLEELRVRSIFDQFFMRLERIENLIRNGVIAPADFHDLFAYWLELIGEHPQDSDAIVHFGDGRREMLWAYIRRYRFNSVVKLFERYGRAAPVETKPEHAFRPRVPRPSSSS